MTPNELMNKICQEADEQTTFYKEISSIAESKNKLKCIELLMEHFNCEFDSARCVVDFIIDGTPLPSNLSPSEIARNNAEALALLNKPKCPICGSTNLSKITTTKKVAKIAMFGIFGMGDNGKTWKCNNCGSKF